MPYDPPGPPPRPHPPACRCKVCRVWRDPPPRPDPSLDPSVMFGGSWDDDLGKAFHDLGEALLDTGPGRLLMGAVERLSGWLDHRRYGDDEDLFGASDDFLGVEDRNSRSRAWGIFAGWWSTWRRPPPYPEALRQRLRLRINMVLGNAHLLEKEPVATGTLRSSGIAPELGALRVAVGENGSVRTWFGFGWMVAIRTEAAWTGSPARAIPLVVNHLSHQDLDAFRDKVQDMMGRIGLSEDENPVPPPPLRETN